MKLGYIVALLMIVLIVGCAPTTPPVETPPAEIPSEEVAPPVEEVAPQEAPPAEELEAPELSDADQEHIDRLKPACERGAIQSCLVLKSTYGIDWPPAVAEEPEASEEPVEPTE